MPLPRLPRPGCSLIAIAVALLVTSCGGDDGAGTPTTVPTTLASTTTSTTLPPTTTTTLAEYVIQRGDTLDRIARRFGVTRQQLIDANGIEDPDRIQAGDTLKIPPPTTTTIPTTTVPNMASTVPADPLDIAPPTTSG
jgi:LysM repeat protein